MLVSISHHELIFFCSFLLFFSLVFSSPLITSLHRRKVAYAALKEGVECVQEDNDRLEEDVLTRFDSTFTLHTHTHTFTHI